MSENQNPEPQQPAQPQPVASPQPQPVAPQPVAPQQPAQPMPMPPQYQGQPPYWQHPHYAPQPQRPYRPEEEYEEEDDRKSILGVIVALFVLMMIAVMLIGATIGVTIWLTSGSGGDSDPDNRPASQLVEELEGVMTTKESKGHALYLSKVCRGVANRLQDNFDNSDIQYYDETTEVAALVGIVGEFATVVDGVNKYDGLDDILKDELLFSLGYQSEDKIQKNELTTEQERNVVRMWNRLADAFQEVANG